MNPRKKLRTLAIVVIAAVAIAILILWLAPPDDAICAREWFGACLER